MRPVLLQVDAFSATPFHGNPAAVCLLDVPRDERWMQNVAAEMNLAETAFVVPQGGDEFALRWFTPTTEVPLCGHATLAAAHALWETGRVARSRPIVFGTQSGRLTASRVGDRIGIDLPARAVAEAPLPDPVARALRIRALWTGRTCEPDTTKFEYVVVASERDVRAAQPDVRALRAIPGGVILTARSDDPAVHIVSRYFAAYYGVDEDPVTGSAHCALATYWAPRLGLNSFVARQASAREGTLGVTIDGDRVCLTGHAVTVLSGELRA
jgi:PhzF family phenazine biosynthesis protein